MSIGKRLDYKEAVFLHCKKLVTKIEILTMLKVRVQCGVLIDPKTRKCPSCGGVYGSSMVKKKKKRGKTDGA